jgi:DNA-directed RNA polymerase subunit K/omega
MVKRPDGISAFEFSVLSALRAVQLSRGCTPRVQRCDKLAVTAQHEVAERKVTRSANVDPTVSDAPHE